MHTKNCSQCSGKSLGAVHRQGVRHTVLWWSCGAIIQLVLVWPANASITTSGSLLPTPRRQCRRSASILKHSITARQAAALLSDCTRPTASIRLACCGMQLSLASSNPSFFCISKHTKLSWWSGSFSALVSVTLHPFLLLSHTIAGSSSFSTASTLGSEGVCLQSRLSSLYCQKADINNIESQERGSYQLPVAIAF